MLFSSLKGKNAGPMSSSAAHNIASATRQTLSNGIVVIIHRNPSCPTVSLRGEVRVGAVNELATKSGLADFTANMLIRGTTHRTFQQIVAETEERGCNISTSGGMHSSGFYGKALTEDFPLILEILADVLMNPTFPEEEIEKLRGIWLMNLREQEQETGYQAGLAASQMLYPSEHPYSRMSSGTIETVQHLTRDDMVAFHKYYHPLATSLAIVGDVDPTAVLSDLEKFLGSWNVQDSPITYTMPPVSPLQSIQRRNIAMEGKVQSDILWCVHGLKRSDPQYYAAMVGNLILGQFGMGGRLGYNMRENQGLAYSAQSNIHAGLEAGPWLASAGVNPAHVERAIEAMLYEIAQFKQEGPTEEELADARSYLTGNLVLGLETNNGIAAKLLYMEYYGLGLDYIARYPSIINNVSREEIIEVARAYLSTDYYVLVVAGPPMIP